MKITTIIITGSELRRLFAKLPMQHGDYIQLGEIPAGATYLGTRNREDGGIEIDYSEPDETEPTLSVGNRHDL